MLTASYKSSSSALTGQVVTEDGGSSGAPMIVDALVGTSAPPTLISTTSISGGGLRAINFTVHSSNAGDVLYLMLAADSVGNINAIGKIGLPLASTAVGVSPIVVIQNCISANFNSALRSMAMVPGRTPLPPANITETTNLAANPFNGTSFGSPSWATVFADADQTHFDYRLAVSSPAKNAASNPGTSPRGQDLIPHYQTKWHGSTAGGTPIPAKAPRSDIAPALTGSIGALT
jgi:hypothetical protein